MVKTVTLTADTPQKITFDGAYPFYWIDNKSTADVYASVGIPEADADGTYTVAAGSQMRISCGVGNDGITLLGEGKVQVVASAIAACPFKLAQKGGGGNYSKPDGGIPKADLAADVQTSLTKADAALQQHQSLDGYAAKAHTHDDRYYSKSSIDSFLSPKASKSMVSPTSNGLMYASDKKKLDELTSGNSACVCGIYTGDGVIPRTISLGFTPSAVLISSENGAMGATSTVTKSGALAVGNSVGCTYNSASSTKYTEMVGIVSGGFQLLSSNSNHSNGYTYHYIAFK